MVLYLKYRPQRLQDIDTISVRDQIRAILSSSYVPHAFLFSGSRGAGKTSTARIVAKWFLCKSKNQELGIKNQGKGLKTHVSRPMTVVDVCGVCDSCVGVAAGSYLDVIEIDAASNRGIDDIRQLKEGISLSPVMGAYKVYIIDEVHMLTSEAFNALLKTLEEPPAHVIFLFATTDPEKVPETIRSRTTHISFPTAGIEEMCHALARVVKGEGVQVSDDILRYLAQISDGSFRDATKYIEQVLSERLFDLDAVQKKLGSRAGDLHLFVQHIAKKDASRALMIVESLRTEGRDVKRFVADLLHQLHALLLAQHGISPSAIDIQIDTFTSMQTQEIIKLLSRVYVEIKTASIPELPLEIAVVEWCNQKV